MEKCISGSHSNANSAPGDTSIHGVNIRVVELRWEARRKLLGTGNLCCLHISMFISVFPLIVNTPDIPRSHIIPISLPTVCLSFYVLCYTSTSLPPLHPLGLCFPDLFWTSAKLSDSPSAITAPVTSSSIVLTHSGL